MGARRLTLAAAAICGSAALATGCGGTAGAGNGAAGVVPASVSAYIAIDSDPDSSQWKTVNDLAGHFPDKQKGVDSIKKELRKDPGLDWERDLKPALGPEIDVVWLDFAHDGENVVALMQPRDEDALKRAIAKGNAHGKDPADKLFYEKVGEWEVMADAKTKIDRFRRESGADGAKLADDASFKRAMSALSEDSLVKAYVNGQKVMDAIGEYGGPDVNKFITKAGTLDWVVAALRASSDGVRFDTVVRGTPGKLFKSVKVGSGFRASLPKQVPADANFYVTFHGQKGMLSGLKDNPLLQDPGLQPVLGILRSVGDILQGENAFYIRRGVPNGIPEITLVTEPRPGMNATTTLDRILRRFRGDIGVVPHRTRIAGTDARTLDFGEFELDYSAVGKRFVVTDLPAGISSLKRAGPKLAQSDTFKDAVDKSGMPTKTQGFFYVNVRGGLDLAQRLSDEPIPAEVKRNLKPLRSVVEYAATRPSEVQVTFFVRIK
jgi:hypothetical protein